MSEIEQRIINLIAAEMDAADWSTEGKTLDWNATLADYGLNSMIAVQFLKAVNREFDIEVPVEEAQKMTCLRDLVNFIESQGS